MFNYTEGAMYFQQQTIGDASKPSKKLGKLPKWRELKKQKPACGRGRRGRQEERNPPLKTVLVPPPKRWWERGILHHRNEVFICNTPKRGVLSRISGRWWGRRWKCSQPSPFR